MYITLYPLLAIISKKNPPKNKNLLMVAKHPVRTSTLHIWSMSQIWSREEIIWTDNNFSQTPDMFLNFDLTLTQGHCIPSTVPKDTLWVKYEPHCAKRIEYMVWTDEPNNIRIFTQRSAIITWTFDIETWFKVTAHS